MHEKKSPIYVAMTGDSEYVYPLGVAMSSLAAHCSYPIRLSVAIPVDWRDVLRPEELGLLLRFARSLGWEASAVECPIDASTLPRLRHISSMTFLKPALFDVATPEVLLFIDADVVAVADWTHMVGYSSATITAARETNMAYFEQRWAPQLPPGWYLNAGILVARPDEWRTRYGHRWRQLLANYGQLGFRYLEQDVMNAAILGDAGVLPREFNVRPAYGDSLENAVIVHYAGWWKPWLTVKAELRTLDPLLRASYEMYVQAEDAFWAQVSQLPKQDRDQWRRAHRSVRGIANWRAQYRYRRWDIARRVRRLIPSF